MTVGTQTACSVDVSQEERQLKCWRFLASLMEVAAHPPYDGLCMHHVQTTGFSDYVFILKMATLVFVETLDGSEYSTRHIHES
jgi:hypothetical protein